MGIVDIENLHKIYRECVNYCKENNLPYQFKVDSGKWETAIEFTGIGYHHPPKSKSWEEVKANGNEIKCPDILDFKNRIIIEYEEEPQPGKKGGKLGKKGHSSESKKDTHRDMLYRIAGFRLCKIWETEYKSGEWIKKLQKFLLECSITKTKQSI